MWCKFPCLHPRHPLYHASCVCKVYYVTNCIHISYLQHIKLLRATCKDILYLLLSKHCVTVLSYIIDISIWYYNNMLSDTFLYIVQPQDNRFHITILLYMILYHTDINHNLSMIHVLSVHIISMSTIECIVSFRQQCNYIYYSHKSSDLVIAYLHNFILWIYGGSIFI